MNAAKTQGRRQIEGRRYDTGELVRITLAGESIACVEPFWSDRPIDDWPFIAPGLFDIQVNGYGGRWFANPELTADDVIEVVRGFQRHGVTRMFPTLVTASHEALAGGLAAIREACRRDRLTAATVVGCHLEGPHISSEDGPRGAHPIEHVRPADLGEFDKLQEIAEGTIRLVTLAPEVDGGLDFIRGLRERNVTAAIGHTAADSITIQEAVAAGACLSTHLGNAAHPVLPRHPNYIWDQLGTPELWASVITDGFHLSAGILRSIVAAKTVSRTIVTCDASGLAGCAPGEYRTPSGLFEVLPDGRIVIAGQRQLLAGSGVTTDECVLRAARLLRMPLATTWDMASRNPARLLGLDVPMLRRGAAADLVQFRCGGGATLVVPARFRATSATLASSAADLAMEPVANPAASNVAIEGVWVRGTLVAVDAASRNS